MNPGSEMAAPVPSELSLDERIKLEQRLLGRRRNDARSSSIPARASRGPCAASFAQSGLWLVEQIDPTPGRYNIARAFRLRGALNAEALQGALDALVSRHEALRTRLVMREGVLEQCIEPHRPFALKRLDLRGRSRGDAERALDDFLRSVARDGFDLAADVMLRAGLARWDTGRIHLRHHRPSCRGRRLVSERAGP